MELKEYLNENKDDLELIREIITQYGFRVKICFGSNNKDFIFDFIDAKTDLTLFILRINSQTETINLMGLIEFLVEFNL